MFPDIEDHLKTELADALDVSAVTSTTGGLPAGEFVKLNRTGGNQSTKVTDAPTVTFECWAEADGTRTEAAEFADEVRSVVLDLKGVQWDGAPVHRVREAPEPGVRNEPDPDTGRHRVIFDATFVVGRTRDGS